MPIAVSLDAMVRAVRREVGYRVGVYAHRVRTNKMRPEAAAEGIDEMKAVLEALEELRLARQFLSELRRAKLMDWNVATACLNVHMPDPVSLGVLVRFYDAWAGPRDAPLTLGQRPKAPS